MARSLYVPVHLHARLVRVDETRPAVPTLDADPCAAPTGPALAPGVHLHWALPDALTRGEVDRTSQQLRFPALPDRWIVVRFASVSVAAPAPGVLVPPRTCKAFVVDAKLRVSASLGALPFAPDREPRWLTVLGLLADGTPPPASAGQTPASAHLEAAYYPSARDRFGFYDDLADLQPKQALAQKLSKSGPWEAMHLSYAVVGHYSSSAEDPLARAGDDAGRLEWLERARLRVDLPEVHHKHRTTVHGKPLVGSRKLGSEAVSIVNAGGRATTLTSESIKTRLGNRTTSNELNVIVEGVDFELKNAAKQQLDLAGLGVKTIDIGASVPEDSSGVPSRLVCHGAVVDVGPRGRYRHASEEAGRVDIADSASAAIEQAFLEIGGAEVFAILRGGLGGEANSTAGKQSLPHLLHAAGFDASPQEAPDQEYLAIVVDHGTPSPPVHTVVPPGAALRIIDRRTAPDSTPLPFGIPVEELPQLRLALKTARVDVEARPVPKPRWHRPATPVLALGGHGRSYRHGHDGRMRADGQLLCRAGGQTAMSLAYYARRIGGNQLVDLGTSLRFEPAFVRELLFEAALLDPSNAARAAGLALMGVQGPTQTDVDVALKTFHEATERWWALGDPGAALPDAIALFSGTLPAPFAVTPWSEPWLPLFAELRYTLKPDCTASAAGQSLGELDLAVVAAKPSTAIDASERQVLSSMLPATVQSAIARLRDRLGTGADVKPLLDQLIYRLAHLDIMTASLGELDPRVRAQKSAFRSGSLAVTSLRLVDTFGTVRTIELLPGRVLPPRLTAWARVQTRLVGTTGDGDANPVRSPVCGFLLFDAVEQALEAFDPVGAPLGQLRHDRSPAHKTLWERAPSRDATDLAGVQAPVLKDILQAMLAPRDPETGATALQAAIAALDTARFTVGRRLASDDYRAALCGRPIVVVRAHLSLELAGVGASDSPSGAAANLPDKVHVRLGCLEQLDDGLLGFFMHEDGAWHLHPIPHAATDAAKSPYLKHPLLRESTSLELAPGAANKREVILLLDGLSAFHVQTGLLPRKRIEVSELIPARILAQILPTLAVGPLLFESARRRVPAPQLPGHSWSWVNATADDFTVSPIAPFAPATSEMPDAPPAVHAGWLRLDLDKP